MTKWLKKTFALSDQGARDLHKAIWCCTATDVGLFLPICLFFLLLQQWTAPYLKLESVHLNIGIYIGLCAAALLLIYLLEHVQYNATFLKSFTESSTRRVGIAEKLRRLPLDFFGKRNLSDLTTTILSDCADLEKAFSRPIPELFGAVFSLVPIALVLAVTDWRMTLGLLWVVPAAFALCIFTKKLQDSHRLKYMENKLGCAAGIQECIENIGDIRACGMEERYLNQLDGLLDAQEEETIRGEMATGICVTASQMILKLGIGTTVLLGGSLLVRGELDFITFLVFLIAAARIYEPLSGAIGNLAAVFNTMTQVERAREITDYPIQKGEGSRTYEGCDIVFEHVRFAYQDKESVLQDVSFTAHQGQVTALIGPSGGGKTTVSRLAARFYDPDSGKITLGGIDITTVDPEEYLKNFAIVFQDVTLFNSSIMENIRIGKNKATDAEVIAAAKAAQCEEFISRLPDGYAAEIGENGAVLSGGERQRISIARALLKNAPVVILDEATASLDPENETKVQQAITELTRNKTVLIIAHRMRTISGADKIVVLDNGTVAEEGTPAELLRVNGRYAHLMKLQTFNGEK